MTTNLNRVLILVFTVFICNTAFSQFTVSGEYRPRAEYRHGFRTLAVEDQRTAFFIDQRSRLNIDYKNEKYQFKLIFQDVRTWGSQSQLVTNDGALTTIHEAWASVMINENLSLKLGRQEIIYDDHRIFGNVGWLQQARSHDAGIFQFTPGEGKLDVGLAFNQDGPKSTDGFYTVPNSYKTFQFLRYFQEFGNLKGSFLFLNNGKQGGTPADYKTYFSQTIGTRLNYDAGDLKPGLTFFYQGGDEPDGVTSISAIQYQVDLGYSLSEKTSITAGMEFMSGNDEVNPGPDNKAFNPFYGTNHKFNGLMDYFYVGNHIGSVGLQDIFVMLKTKVGKVGTQAHVHFFSSDGDVLNSTDGTAMDKSLGTEIDLLFNYKPNDYVALQGGYSHMFATDSMVELKNAVNNDATSNWAFIMMTLKPKFFTTKKEDNAD